MRSLIGHLLICAVVAVIPTVVNGVILGDIIQSLTTSSQGNSSIATGLASSGIDSSTRVTSSVSASTTNASASTAIRSASTLSDSASTIDYASTAKYSASTVGASASIVWASASIVTDTASTTVSTATQTPRASHSNGSTRMTRFPANIDISTFVTATMSTTSDILVRHKNDDYQIVLTYFGNIVVPVTLVVGLIGNSGTLFALQGQAFNKLPSRYILSALAVSDSLALITSSLNTKMILDFIGRDVRAINRNGCKVFKFVAHLAKLLSSWFVVLVCCERFVAICLPLRAKQICTKSNAIIGIAVTVISLAAFDGVWTLSSEKVGSKCNSSFWTRETELRGKLLMYIGSSLIGFLPMTIMLILTPIMCITLHRNRVYRKRLNASDNPVLGKVSAMLISVCISYIVLMLPILTAHNIAFLRGENLYATEYLPLKILGIVGEKLSIISFSCNFFLYVACNRAFRCRVHFALTCFRRNEAEGVSHSLESILTVISNCPDTRENVIGN